MYGPIDAVGADKFAFRTLYFFLFLIYFNVYRRFCIRNPRKTSILFFLLQLPASIDSNEADMTDDG